MSINFKLQSKLQKKIDDEFNLFFLNKMCTSKENIFACSCEIELKKIIKQQFFKMIHSMDDETKQLLLCKENLLESSYRFCKDNNVNPYAKISDAMNKWIKFITYNQ